MFQNLRDLSFPQLDWLLNSYHDYVRDGVAKDNFGWSPIHVEEYLNSDEFRIEIEENQADWDKSANE